MRKERAGVCFIMKQVDINKIIGYEILAKDICTESGTVIIPAGCILHKKYVTKLIELGITSIYIREEVGKEADFKEKKDSIEEKIQHQCRKTVRTTLEKYSYCGNVELSELSKVADDIMNDILTEPEVIYNVSLIREQSDSVYAHCVNVAALSVLVALRMKLAKRRIRDIAVGALLHDLGIIFIPMKNFNTKFEDWTEEQRGEFKKHVIIGYSVVENEKWLSSAAKDIILSHHERVDGSGYPMRLRGDHMKIGTKIVAVCDFFDRSIYGNFAEKQKVHNVIDYITSQAGMKFDFRVVDNFVASVAAYPIGANVLTNEGEIGMVIRQNPKVPTRPVIRMLFDEDGKQYPEKIEKDLTRELTLFICDILEDLL